MMLAAQGWCETFIGGQRFFATTEGCCKCHAMRISLLTMRIHPRTCLAHAVLTHVFMSSQLAAACPSAAREAPPELVLGMEVAHCASAATAAAARCCSRISFPWFASRAEGVSMLDPNEGSMPMPFPLPLLFSAGTSPASERSAEYQRTDTCRPKSTALSAVCIARCADATLSNVTMAKPAGGEHASLLAWMLVQQRLVNVLPTHATVDIYSRIV